MKKGISIKHRLRFVGLALSCTALITGCGGSPNLTDEEIIALFGEKSPFADKDAPLIISGMDECAAALAGLNDDLVRNYGASALGQCKELMSDLLGNKSRNTKNLTMGDIKDKKLAEQIVAAGEKSRQ